MMERKGCDLAMEIARAESDASQKHSQGGGGRLEDKHSSLTACLLACLPACPVHPAPSTVAAAPRLHVTLFRTSTDPCCYCLL